MLTFALSSNTIDMSNNFFFTKSILKKARVLRNESPVFTRHMRLNKQYVEDPESAMITDHAEIIGTNLHDPFHTSVTMNDELKVPFKVGVHRAVGGDHDYPNPGDMLCATLAACLESTLRMIANRYGVTLTRTKVHVSALVDVRGTLRINHSSAVAFQSMQVDLEVEAKGLSKKVLNTLIRGTKKSCIIFQTLRKGLPISVNVKSDT